MAVWIPYWDLRCEKCSDSLKKMNGCDEDSVMPDRWVVRELTWQRCPIKLITITTSYFLNAYNYFQKGILPYQQGFKRNSNRYIEAMGVIDNEVKKIEAQNLKQIKK